MNIKKITSTIFKTKTRIICLSIVLAVILLGIIFVIVSNEKPKADTTHLNQLLIDSSDLTTAKLNITNITEYKDKGVKFLNRSDFIMVYNATVWAGIDMEKVKISAEDISKVIRVSVPKATIQNVKVDSSSIKYFDEKFSLFNVNAKDDVNSAVILAEESVKEEAKNTGILELADKQSVTLIEGLLFKAIPKGYTLEVKVK